MQHLSLASALMQSWCFDRLWNPPASAGHVENSMRGVWRNHFSEKKSLLWENKPSQHSELTDVPQYRERERMGLWKHAAHHHPPPHPHEFSYSSDAVQERSARTFTALTYNPTQLKPRHPATTHTITTLCILYVKFFGRLTFYGGNRSSYNPLQKFPQG